MVNYSDKIPCYFENRIKATKDQKLTTLDLSPPNHKCKLDYIPKTVFELTQLKELILSGNRLTNLPESVGNLKNLTKLYLSDNQLASLPESIGKLRNLTELHLRENQLTRLPESIGKLRNLTELYLKGNQLTSLPESIGNLANLTELYLSYNQLTTLPKSIDNLTNLTDLYLSYNQLITLPESIGNLPNLTELDLRINPLQTPPLEIAIKGILAIKKYFEQLEEKGEDYIYEAKLLIVGEAGAGKTSLAKKIKNSEYQLVENEKSTEGIDVIKWSFPLPDKERDFQVNIWDFGGQEIYHATHQFFLTKRSLYTLVADTRKEDTDFYYWLNVVDLLSDNSPLLIVKNEKQDRYREVNESELRGQFSNFKETLATNLKTNRGLEKIVETVKYYIKDLPHIGQKLPATWVLVRKALENNNNYHIYLQEFFKICQDNGFTSQEDKLQLSGYLHDLGVCLHFQDEEESLLYKTVILKPEWGTSAVYQVLDNKQVINTQGCFTRNDLKNIWYEDKYSSMRGELLELMKKFQLCYEIPECKDTFIAPQLLSKIKPDYEWSESSNLILRYTYPDFMPKGIITRFIVIMHQYIDQQKYVWKTGVILNKDNTKAEVIEYYGKREIRIRVVGSYKRDLLINITYELDKIHNSYNRLKFNKLVPCNCEICKYSQSPHFYSFDILRKFIINRQEFIQCQNSFKMVSVLDLIDDISDFKKLITEDKQDRNKSIHFEGDIQKLVFQLLEKGDISGDFMTGNRKIEISGGTVNASGAGAFALGDNYGTVANTINQLPSSSNPDKPGIKELLTQLQEAIDDPDLSAEDQEEVLEQLQVLGTAGQKPQEQSMQKKAKKAVGFLKVIAEGVEPTTKLAQACATVLPKILLFFGLGS